MVAEYTIKSRGAEGIILSTDASSTLRDASFMIADGESILSFTTEAIAGQPFTFTGGGDDVVAAAGIDNQLGFCQDRGIMLL